MTKMAKEKKKGFFAEFREFIAKGNIIDMAVGVVIGAAFKAIVSSLVADIIMPAVGKLTGNVDISSLKAVLTPAVIDENGAVTVEEVAIRYGQFIQYVIDFLIIAFCMFIVVKVAMSFHKIMELRKKTEEEAEAQPEEPKEPTTEEKTLAALEEIRDFLKENK